ncbi:MAG: isoprenyl transferase [Candidatus Omnitrophica bacterium]|nr:isoprenyl transferase [Candidatus Omnitrophota bacterium]MBL7210270.1 isoprenyl transferase [Candidatus Omnitrophota bacterium]
MLDKNNIPKHIAIIMDGNGRWARERGLSRTAGHREGVKRVREIIRAAAELGVKVLTFFAFSTENWTRPKSEIRLLMRYLDNFLGRQLEELDKNNIRLRVIGRGDPIPRQLQEKVRRAEEQTRNNTRMTVVLALNYGGRQEITDAARGLAEDVLKGNVKIKEINDEFLSRYLYTAGLPDPDLLIRTSGQMRISNFLLWQISYAELYFPEKYWPSFRKKDLEEAIEEYQRRERRFGGVYAYKKNN